jgi:hypothetical protein
MLSRFHPIEDGLWDDPKFDETLTRPEAPGEERGFFAFLSSNKMQRAAGIYRATDEELSAAARIPIKRVRFYLADLQDRDLIVRDGLWVFCPGYWKRQAHNPGFVKSARLCVVSCSSAKVQASFIYHYPLHREWLPNGWPTVDQPSSEIARTDAEAVTEEQHNSNRAVGSVRSPEASAALDPTLKAILADCPNLSLVSNGESGPFWDQVLSACEPYGVADAAWIGKQLRSWNQWFEANPTRKSRDRKKLEARLLSWLGKDLDRLSTTRRPA